MSWIDGSDGIYNDPQYIAEGGQPWSYKAGWIGSSNMVAYTGAVRATMPRTASASSWKTREGATCRPPLNGWTSRSRRGGRVISIRSVSR